MAHKELRAMNRAELLEFLRERELETERLAAENAELRRQLSDRQLNANRLGSIADAAISVSGVFRAAQESADIYVENARAAEARYNYLANEIESNAVIRANGIMRECESRCVQRETAERQYIERLWLELRARLEQYCRTRTGLEQILALLKRVHVL